MATVRNSVSTSVPTRWDGTEAANDHWARSELWITIKRDCRLTGRRPATDRPSVVVVSRPLQVGLPAGVLRRRAARRRRGQELQHPHDVIARIETVVPAVPAEEHRVARRDHLDFTEFRIGDDQFAFQHAVGNVRRKYRLVRLAVTKLAAWRHSNSRTCS